MECKDVVLLVARSARLVVTPVQLQKAVFLVSEENLPGLPDELYDFQPYHYGPFDSRVYDDAKKLYEEGLVLRTQSWQGRWVDTMITPAGSERADELRAALPKRTARQIDEIVQLVQSLSFRDLLGYIYKKYPKYRENSVFQF